MSLLLSEVKIRGVTFKNRIAMAPMCQYSSADGFASDWHLAHYGARAAGGVGLIIQEATAVLPEGRITPGDIGIWNDDHIPGLRRVADFINSLGSVAGIQLAHAGRKASCALPWNGGKQLDLSSGGWRTVAPSPLPFTEGDRLPLELDRAGLEKIVSAFKSAALRALECGYRVVEIHSAHGYLLQEFLSPLSNKRTDEYGGPFENRIRLLVEVVDAVRSVWPDNLPLFARISSTEWVEGGWTPEESIKLGAILKDHGVDLIDCSSGGNIWNAQIPFIPLYQVGFAEMVRTTGIMTGAVGLITEPEQAEAILQEEKADLILFGRELLRNPHFPLQASKKLSAEIKWPNQYLRAK